MSGARSRVCSYILDVIAAWDPQLSDMWLCDVGHIIVRRCVQRGREEYLYRRHPGLSGNHPSVSPLTREERSSNRVVKSSHCLSSVVGSCVASLNLVGTGALLREILCVSDGYWNISSLAQCCSLIVNSPLAVSKEMSTPAVARIEVEAALGVLETTSVSTFALARVVFVYSDSSSVEAHV